MLLLFGYAFNLGFSHESYSLQTIETKRIKILKRNRIMPPKAEVKTRKSISPSGDKPATEPARKGGSGAASDATASSRIGASGGAGRVEPLGSDDKSLVSAISTVGSELHHIGRASGQQSHPAPKMEYIKIEESGAGMLSIRIPKERPPTQHENQGRHVSAYSLMVEAVLSRVTGRSPDEIVSLIYEMLKEYISNNEALKKYSQTVEDAKKLHEPNIFAVDERIKIDRALRASLRFFKSDAVTNVFSEVSGDTAERRRAKNCYKQDKEAVLAIEEKDLNYIRNLLKRSGELAPYTEIINVAITNAIKLFNKMDQVSFSPKATKAPKDEGPAVNRALNILRNQEILPAGEAYTDDSIFKIGEAIADLFDYPSPEIIMDGMSNDDIANSLSLCRNVIRRHIKFIYDAFPKIRTFYMDKEKLKKLLTPLLIKVRENFGWQVVESSVKSLEPKQISFASDDKLFNLLIEYMEISEKGCFLLEGKKFSAKNPEYPNVRKAYDERQAAARSSFSLARAGLNDSFGRLSVKDEEAATGPKH
ncbi:MAG: hypothetical protein K0R66_191 [Gammaproteobacteria bacterium]|jgi:hypothetical protein|nr:hypothetical protein [Gammaproteobacteria bacterium]